MIRNGKEVDLSEQELKEVDIGRIDCAEHIRQVNLSMNLFTEIPANLCHLEGLVYLNLKCNRIESFKGLKKLRSLRKLDLSFNGIKTLQGLHSSSISSLDLSFNELKVFSQFDCLPNLIELNASHNSIERLVLPSSKAKVP